MTPLPVWLQAARLKTLSASLVPVVTSATLAFRLANHFELLIFLDILFCTLLIQIGTNFINDAWDFKKGADSSERLGPPRVSQMGLIDPNVLLQAGFVILFFALLLGVPLVARGGFPIVAIGLASLFFAWGYTAGPFPLAYNGLGELFVFLFFGIIAALGTFYLLTLEWSFDAFVLGTQIGCFSVLLIAINNLRDIHQDKKNNKNTLAVLMGESLARKEIVLFCVLPFLISVYWLHKFPLVFFLTLPVCPFLLHIGKNLSTLPPSREFNRYLGKASLLELLFGISFSLSLLWV